MSDSQGETDQRRNHEPQQNSRVDGEQIEENLPSLGVWQRRGLAVLVFGLLTLGQAQLSKIAEGVPEEGSYNTVRQRVKRWVSNRDLSWVEVG